MNALKQVFLKPSPRHVARYRDPGVMHDIKADYAKLWEQEVEAHAGVVQRRASVTINTETHKHLGYVLHSRFDLDEHCEHCEYALALEAVSRHSPEVGRPRIYYTLDVVRKCWPREMITVPLPVPQHRLRKGRESYHRRIQKKWETQARGKTTLVHKTELIQLGVSKLGLNLIRAHLAKKRVP